MAVAFHPMQQKDLSSQKIVPQIRRDLPSKQAKNVAPTEISTQIRAEVVASDADVLRYRWGRRTRWGLRGNQAEVYFCEK